MKHFLYLLVACLLLVSYVRCDGGSPDDGIGGDVKRELDINVGGSSISIDSRSRTDVDNRIRIEIQVSGDSGPNKNLGARLRAYTHASGSGSNAIAQVDFKVKFQQLVEYVEVDGVAGYSTNDTTGATIVLGNENYVFAQQADIGTGLDAVKVATATSSHFKITCKMGGALFNDSGVWAFTNSAKVDIDITNFPYTLAGSRVALIVGLVSQRTQYKAIQHDDTQPHVDSDAVVVRSGGVNGVKDAFFSWAKQVTVVPAETADVVAGPLTTGTLDSDDDSTNDDKKTVVYSFLTAPQPTSIHWDPLFGANTLSGVASVMPTMLALVAMLVCVAFVL